MISKGEQKRIKALSQKKFREQFGEFVVEGVKVVSEAITSEFQLTMSVVSGAIVEDEKTKEVMSLASKESIPVYVVKEKEYKAISNFDTPPGILAVVKKSGMSVEAGKPYLILDAIKDPGNLGTIIRTADWFGIKNIILGKDSVDVFNPKVAQSTMGSIFHVNIIQDQDVPTYLEQLKSQEYTLIATSLHGEEKLPELKKDKWALIVGNESHGVDQSIIDKSHYQLLIPKHGQAESLNVAVATGVVLSKLV